MTLQDPERPRRRSRSIVRTSMAFTLSICACWPSRGQERRGTCGEEGETLAIYDCNTGLVLWSRRQPGQRPPVAPPDSHLCRLVVGPSQPVEAAEKCL